MRLDIYNDEDHVKDGTISACTANVNEGVPFSRGIEYQLPERTPLRCLWADGHPYILIEVYNVICLSRCSKMVWCVN